MTNPLVSIIIPTFNRAHLIGETLDSIIAQTYQNWECIVVDDGSTDNTSKVMTEYVNRDSRIQYYIRPNELTPGGNDARNYGFELSNGAWIHWMDDDDIMLPQFLSYFISYIKPGVNLLMGPISIWNPKDGSKRIKTINIQTSIYTDYICWKLKIYTPSVLFRKTFLDGKTLFSSDILRGQETEFFLRIFYDLKPEEYIILEKSYFLYRQHSLSKSGKNKKYMPEFMDSTFRIYFDNYIKNLDSENTEASRFCYEHLLGIFYHSIHHKDMKLANKIRNAFFPILKNRNKKKAFEIIFISQFFILFKRGVWRFIKRWKKFEF